MFLAGQKRENEVTGGNKWLNEKGLKGHRKIKKDRWFRTQEELQIISLTDVNIYQRVDLCA